MSILFFRYYKPAVMEGCRVTVSFDVSADHFTQLHLRVINTTQTLLDLTEGLLSRTHGHGEPLILSLSSRGTFQIVT